MVNPLIRRNSPDNLPDGFWDQLSSVGPDKGTKCTLFE